MEPLAPVTASVRRRLEMEGADSAGGVTRVIIADPAESYPSTMLAEAVTRALEGAGAGRVLMRKRAKTA
jgi:hypothetical protein